MAVGTLPVKPGTSPPTAFFSTALLPFMLQPHLLLVLYTCHFLSPLSRPLLNILLLSLCSAREGGVPSLSQNLCEGRGHAY